jgi:hypothetical protein
MTKNKFKEIFEINRKKAQENNLKADVVSNNGTSQSVLDSLKALSDPEEMKKAVDELSTDMYETFQAVHKADA